MSTVPPPIQSAPSARYPQPLTYSAARLSSEPSAREVVVVGAGPVGLAAALGLARRGIQVTVVEAGTGVSYGSRAICFSRHSLEILDRLGVGPPMTQLSLAWTGGRSFYREHEVLGFRMPVADHDVRPPMVNVSQGVAEQLLVDAVHEDDDVEILWGVRVAGVESTPDGVAVDLQTTEGARRLHARWVVAADGARSDVRRLLGLSMRGTSYEGRYVIADIHLPADLPAERRVWFDPDSAPGSTIIMHRQPNDIWRVDYQLRPDEDVEHELAPERIQERITRHLKWLGVDTPWTLEWSSVYRAHSLSLDDYVHGHVLFAGDAAHLVPIFGVRGLNSGLEDADTLAWQLAAVVRGTAEPSLLAAYSAERRDAWAQNIANAGKSTRIMSPESVGDVLTRDALLALAVHEPEFRPLIDPRQSTATHTRHSPLTWQGLHKGEGLNPGDPLTDQAVEVMTASGPLSSTLFAELGTGFAIIGIDVEPTDLLSVQQRMTTVPSPDPVRTAVVSTAADGGPGTIRLLDDRLVLGQPGDVLVIRPDGLILCRVAHPERDRLDDLVCALRRGAAPAATPTTESSSPASTLPMADTRMEDIWTSLSEALDEADDAPAFLTRFVLALGRHTDITIWREALKLSRTAQPRTRDASASVTDSGSGEH